jgi:hypothetical protein
MFTSDVCEAKQEEIKMEGIDPNALWDLVQFAYTGTVNNFSLLPLINSFKTRYILVFQLL